MAGPTLLQRFQAFMTPAPTPEPAPAYSQPYAVAPASVSFALPDPQMRFTFAGAGNRQINPAQPRGSLFWGFPADDDVYVDEYVALSLSTVWACIMAISEAIAASNLQVFTRDEEKNKVQLFGRYHKLLNDRPNPEQTAFDFIMTICVNALLGKGGFAEIVRDGRGRAVALYPIHYDRICRERHPETKELWFRVHNYTSEDAYIHHEDMFFIRGFALDGENTCSVVEFARDVLSRAVATRDFGSAFYRNGTNFGGVFLPKERIGLENAEKYAGALRGQFAGARRAHGTYVMPDQFDYKPMGIEPDKAQFIQTEQHLIEEICRFFRVPPHKVQHLLRSTNNNIEHQGIEFVRDAVTPWAQRIREELNYKVLGAQSSLECRFDLDWLREGDAKSVAEAESMRIHSGQSCPDEARTRRGEDPQPGGFGKKFVVQQGMTTWEKVGEENGETANPSSEPSDEEDEGGPSLVIHSAAHEKVRQAAGRSHL